MKERIYLASSWRNPYQAEVLAQLREAGHQVYDFKNPEPGNSGFGWQQCLIDGKVPERNEKGEMRPAEWRKVLNHPRSREGFNFDFGQELPRGAWEMPDYKGGMRWATAGVLLLPCGRSAHAEFGWLCGSGRHCYVYCPPQVEWVEPELMDLMAHPDERAEATIALSLTELLYLLDRQR